MERMGGMDRMGGMERMNMDRMGPGPGGPPTVNIPPSLMNNPNIPNEIIHGLQAGKIGSTVFVANVSTLLNTVVACCILEMLNLNPSQVGDVECASIFSRCCSCSAAGLQGGLEEAEGGVWHGRRGGQDGHPRG